MTEKKYNVNLFLRNEEMEQLMELQDFLWSLEPEDEKQYEILKGWAEVLCRVVLGKNGHSPLMISRRKDEGTN